MLRKKFMEIESFNVTIKHNAGHTNHSHAILKERK